MAQIFCLAPSIRPPMLPVVSRQKTTSTRGFGAGAFWLSAKAGDAAKAVKVARTTVILDKEIGKPDMANSSKEVCGRNQPSILKTRYWVFSFSSWTSFGPLDHGWHGWHG